MLPGRIIRHRPVLPAGIAPQRVRAEPRDDGAANHLNSPPSGYRFGIFLRSIRSS